MSGSSESDLLLTPATVPRAPTASKAAPAEVAAIEDTSFKKTKHTHDSSKGGQEAPHSIKVLLHNIVKGAFREVRLLESEVLCSHLVNAAKKELQVGFMHDLHWIDGNERLEFDLGEQLSAVGIGNGSVLGVVVTLRTCVLTASGAAKLWDSDTGECLMTLEGHWGVISAKFSADGSRILTAGQDGKLCDPVHNAKIWDSATGECQVTLEGHTACLYSASFSPDDSHVVTTATDGTAKIWDTKLGQCQATLPGHAILFSATFSPDGASVLTGAACDGTARIWETGSGLCLATFEHTGLTPPAFSPDGALVLTVCSDGAMKSWDAKYGHCRMTYAGNGNDSKIHSAVFSPDGAFVLAASSDDTVKLWETDSGQCQMTFEGHEEGVVKAVFSPDGALVLTAGMDGVAKIWETKSGQCQATLEGGEPELNAVAFSPDGSLALTASDDGDVVVWEVESGQWHATLEGEGDVVHTAMFSPEANSSRSCD